MGAKIKCLICGDVIESKSIHEFVECSCENIFIDGGNEYTRFGRRGVEGRSFEWVQACGHPVSSIVSGDDGTNYCGDCAKESWKKKGTKVVI